MSTSNERLYLIPFAPVSLNHAYRSRAIKGRVQVYMDTRYARFGEWVENSLRDQDDARGPPDWDTYSCEYLFLYTEDELYCDALPTKIRGQIKGKYQPKDISNFFKLLEDSLFRYLVGEEADDADERVADLVGRKRCVKRLPAKLERYATNLRTKRYPRGVVLLRVAKGPGFLWEGQDALHRRFEPLLKDSSIEFLAEREGTPMMVEYPEWFEPPGTDLSRARVDPVESHDDWREATHDSRRAVVFQRMLEARTAWMTRVHDGDPEAVSLRILDPEHLRDAWRDIVGWSIPKRVITRERKVRRFDRSWAWAYHLLAEEATTQTMDRLGRLRRLAGSLGRGKRILIYGSGAGTWVYPFAERLPPHELTVVELGNSGVIRVLKKRAKEDELNFHLVRVKRYDQKEVELDGGFDLVVCLDLIDRVRHPYRLLRRLAALAPRLVLSYTFRTARGRKPPRSNRDVNWPWIRTEMTSSNGTAESAPRALIQRFLTQKSKLGLRLAEGTFRDDLLLLEKP